MAAQDVQNIINAIHNAFGAIEERKRTAIEQQRADTQAKAEADRLAFEQQREQREAQIAQANLALQQQAAKVVNLQNLHNLVMSSQQTGIPIPGESIMPIVSGNLNANFPGVGPAPDITQTPQTEVHTFQDIKDAQGNPLQITVPTRLAGAQQAAEIARIANAPAEEAKTREEAAKQIAETQRQAKLQADKQIFEAQENAKRLANELNMKNLEIAGQRSIENQRAATALNVARITATGGIDYLFPQSNIHIVTGNDGAPQVNVPTQQDKANGLQGVLNDLYLGKISQEDLNARFKTSAKPIEAMLSSMNGAPLSKKDQENLKDLETISGIVDPLSKMYLIRANSGTNGIMPGTVDNQQFNAYNDIVNRGIPALSRILSNVNRFNATEMESYLKALIPNRTPILTSPEAENMKYNDFVTREIQNAFNKVTSSLPTAQQNAIRSSIGFNRFPQLGKALNAPGTSAGTPAGATPALPLPSLPSLPSLQPSTNGQAQQPAAQIFPKSQIHDFAVANKMTDAQVTEELKKLNYVIQ